MTKNEEIKQSRKETHLKRKTQYLKVFELKVNCHHTSKEDFQKLNDCFTCIAEIEHRSIICANENQSVIEKVFLPNHQIKDYKIPSLFDI